MSLRLKSHAESCPNGFLYTQLQTHWNSWEHAPNSKWDWRGLVLAVQAHRLANPKLGLPIDEGAIDRELDYVNALRVKAMRGGETYVTDDTGPPPPKSLASRLLSQAARVVAGARKVEAGALTLLDWNLSEHPPVTRTVAISRAGVCSKRPDGKGGYTVCPLNGKGDLTRWFTVPIAEQIRKTLEKQFGVGLTTPLDESLGVCDGCSCPIKLKVWCPASFIKQRMPAEVMADLDPGCWIRKELA